VRVCCLVTCRLGRRCHISNDSILMILSLYMYPSRYHWHVIRLQVITQAASCASAGNQCWQSAALACDPIAVISTRLNAPASASRHRILTETQCSACRTLAGSSFKSAEFTRPSDGPMANQRQERNYHFLYQLHALRPSGFHYSTGIVHMLRHAQYSTYVQYTVSKSEMECTPAMYSTRPAAGLPEPPHSATVPVPYRSTRHVQCTVLVHVDAYQHE